MDSSGEGQLDLRQLAWLLGLLARSDLPSRLRLFYCLHLPPLLDQHELDSPLSGETLTSGLDWTGGTKGGLDWRDIGWTGLTGCGWTGLTGCG